MSKFQIGSRVERVPHSWTGTILVLGEKTPGYFTRTGKRVPPDTKSCPIHWIPDHNHVLVRVTHDKNKNPLRKHIWKVEYLPNLIPSNLNCYCPKDTSEPREHEPVGTYVYVKRHKHGWGGDEEGKIIRQDKKSIVVKTIDGDEVICRHRRDYILL